MNFNEEVIKQLEHFRKTKTIFSEEDAIGHLTINMQKLFDGFIHHQNGEPLTTMVKMAATLHYISEQLGYTEESDYEDIFKKEKLKNMLNSFLLHMKTSRIEAHKKQLGNKNIKYKIELDYEPCSKQILNMLELVS
jgi:hypothetical protein